MKTKTLGQGVTHRLQKFVGITLCVLGSGLSTQVLAQVDNNPNVARQCGADIVLVLDASDSIATWLPANPVELDRNGAADLVTEAAYSFLGAFSNTNSRVAVVSYNIDATKQVGFRYVNDHTLRADGSFRGAIGDPGTSATGFPDSPEGYVEDVVDPSLETGFFTNWEAALLATRNIVRPRGEDLVTRPDVPLLVFHVTDGSPNHRVTDAGDITDEEDFSGHHVSDAAAIADLLKEQDGAHIYTVGVGSVGEDELIVSLDNLVSVSGPDIFHQSDPNDVFNPVTDDVLLASDFEQLRSILSGVVLSLCSPSLVVRKWTQDAEDSADYSLAPGWDFATAPLADNNYWQWVDPGDGSPVTTDGRGVARFEWNLIEESVWNASQVQVSEALASDSYEFERVSCAISAGENTGASAATSIVDASGVFTVEVDSREVVTCDVYNKLVSSDEPLLPSIVLDKQVDREQFHALDERIQYTYKVTNAGPGILFDVITVKDDKIDVVTCPSQLPNGALQPGEFVECTGTYVVNADDIVAEKIVNVAIAEAGVLESNEDTETVIYKQIEILLPSIVLDKQVDREKYQAVGERIFYTYEVTNGGPGILVDPVTVEDDKIDVVVCPALPEAGLAPDESVVCEASYVVTEADIEETRIENVAIAKAGDLVSNKDNEIVIYEEPDDKKTPTKKTDKDDDKYSAADEAESSSSKSADAAGLIPTTRTAQWYASRSIEFGSCLDASDGEIFLGGLRIADEKFDDEIDANVGGLTRGDLDTQAESALSLGLGLLNANPARYIDSSRRTRLDQACVATNRQILAAACNVRWLEAQTAINLSAVTYKVGRLCRASSKGRSRRIKRLDQIRSELKEFNRSGRREALPGFASQRSAPAQVVTRDDPTDPHD